MTQINILDERINSSYPESDIQHVLSSPKDSVLSTPSKNFYI